MLLKIDVKPENIIYNEKGRIIIKLDFYSAFSNAAHFQVFNGSTLEDFKKSYGKESRGHGTLFVGTRGGLSIEK